MNGKIAKKLRKILQRQQELKDCPLFKERLTLRYKGEWACRELKGQEVYIRMKDLVWLWQKTPHNLKNQLIKEML